MTRRLGPLALPLKNQHQDQKMVNTTVSEQCPVTGMDVIRRPEWTDIRLDEDYTLTLRVIGDSIFLSQPRGYGTRRGVEAARACTDALIAEFVPEGRPYVWIEDFSGLRGASIETRSWYIEYMKAKPQLMGLIFFGVSTAMKLSVKVAKLLYLVNYDVEIVEDYSEAVRAAVDMLSGRAPQNAGERPARPALSAASQEAETCQATGLPITVRPAWTDIDLGRGNHVSFKLIGDGTILAIPSGNFRVSDWNILSAALADAAESVAGHGSGVVGLIDLSKSRFIDALTSVHQFGLGMPADGPQVAGIVFFNAPFRFRLAFQIARMVKRPLTPVFEVRSYSRAVFKALELRKLDGLAQNMSSRKATTDPDWFLHLGDFSLRFEILGPDILHAITTGPLEEEHIAPSLEMQAKVIGSGRLVRHGSYFYILNLYHSSGTGRKARKQYINSILELHRRFPFRMFILYGADRVLRAGINMARPFVPFKVRVVDGLDRALEVIADEKSRNPESTPLDPGGEEAAPLHSTARLHHYAEELIEFVGGIQWDKLQDKTIPEIDPEHPFAPVFDAFALIKSDLNDLFLERQRADKARLESEAKYRELIENIHDVAFRLDERGRIAYISPSIERQTGFKPDVFIGRPFAEFIHPDDLPGLTEAFNAHTVSNLERIEFRSHKSDGTEIWTSASTRQIIENGEVIGLTGILNDITARKRSEEALKDSEEKARVLLNAPDEAALLIDRRGIILDINELGARFQGKAINELVGYKAQDLSPPEVAELMAARALEVFRTGKPVLIETDFGGIYLETRIFPVIDYTGSVVQVACFTRNVTTEKMAQIEILKARDLAEAASRAKTEFLANVSHELRTPLNPIIGMTDIVLEMDKDPETTEMLGYVRHAAGQLLSLVDDLIELSRIEADGLEPNPRPMSLKSSLNFLFEQLSSEAAKKSLSLIPDIEPGLPDVVTGDYPLLNQVLLKVAGNAVKFTKKGEIRIAVAREPSEETSLLLRFSVSDTGVGIPPDHLHRIFQDFTQADGSTTRAFGGLGLGLTLARRLVTLMNGRIWAESVEGRGSTFHIVLPFEPG